MSKKHFIISLISLAFFGHFHAQTIDPIGLQLWVKSDSGISVTNNKITGWQDLSGNNNHCFQTDTSMAPIFNTSVPALNNKPSLVFDGADDYMLFTTRLTTIRTVFFVIKKNGANGTFESILGDNTTTDFIGSDFANEIFNTSFSSANVLNGSIRVNQTTQGNVANTSKPTNYSIISLTTSGPVSASQITRDRTFANRVWKGEYVELIIYDRVLSASGIDSIETYLSNKYAPPVSLPPDIILTSTFCDTTITTNSAFTNYLWSNGLTTPTISVNQSGKFWIRGTNIFGEVSSDTILVQYPVITLPSKNYFCSGDTLIWNTQLSDTYFNFLWQNSSNDSLMKIYQPGPYFVTVNDAFGCSSSSNTITVNEDTFPVDATLGPDVSLCSGNFITLTSGASPSLTYTWNDGSNNDSLLIVTAGQYSVIVTNTNSCVVKDTINISIMGQAPIANFTTSIGCTNLAVAFTDLSTTFSGNTITSYYWDFKYPSSIPSATSSAHNPYYTYNDTGNYKIYLKIITNMGCEQSVTKTIHIAETPTVNFSYETACRSDSMAFINQSINSAGYFTSTALWNFGDASSGGSNTSHVFSPKHKFSANPGSYFVKLIETNNSGCKDSLTKYIVTFDNSNFNVPSTINGLQLWINGDCVRKTSSHIDTCYDLSSNFNHAIQTNSIKKPLSVSHSLNGHNTIKFDGVDDFLQFDSIKDIRTVFWVAYEDTNATSNFRSLLGSTTRNVYDFIRGQNKEVWDVAYTHPNVLSGQTKINLASVNGATTTLPKNYALISTVTTGTVGADNFSSERNIADRFWQGNLAELIIYNQALSATQVIQIEQYLSKKYAPSVVLPPDLTIINSFCDTTIMPYGTFKNYVWSTGETTPAISVNKTGKYWVTATSIFGEISSDTILVTFPDYQKPAQNYICTGNSLLWDTNLPKNLYTFQWQNNSTDSLFVITQAGNYYASILDNYGCSTTTDTLKVVEDQFSIITSLGNDLIICSGNYITLTSGLDPSYTYSWSTGSTNSSLSIINSGQYSVIVTNTNNCVAKDTINILVQGFAPTANFSTNVGCINQAVSFTNMSSPPAGGDVIDSTFWNFGDPLSATNTSTLTNPSHTYTSTGTYTVNLKVKTDAGCEQSITKIVNIYPVPTATFISGNSCQNDSTAFTNMSTSVPGYSVTSVSWNFGDPGPNNTSNLNNPKHVFGNQTTYTITLQATNNVGCFSTITNTINVKAQVKADFTYSSPCANSPTIFQSTSIVPPPPATPNYIYYFSNSFATTPVANKTFTSSGVHYVTLTVDGTNGCTSSITKLLTVYLPPAANFSITSFCSKDTISIVNLSSPQSGVMSSYDWKLNNTSFSAVQNPTLSLTTATTYSVKLEATNSFECKDAITKSVTVFPIPAVDFTTNPATYYYINSPISFVPTITNANSYQWNITSLPTRTVQSPTETFTSIGSYTVKLDILDQNDCRSSKTKTIAVSKRYLDLAILNINTQKDNDGFITVTADLANYGSVPVSSFDMHYQISDGGNVKESWTGALNPNSFYAYSFISKSASVKNSVNNITCVEIETVNGITDENTNNNRLCNALNPTTLFVSDPLPNPTEGDIRLPITLNRDMDYTIAIYNSVGQIQYDENTQKGLEGLNFVPLPTSSYARGCYIIKVMIDGQIFIKKFIKISSE